MSKHIKSESEKNAQKIVPSNLNEAVHDSSGDVFADIGVELNQVDRLKVNLAYAISEVVRLKGLTQVEAAVILGTTQARVSDIARGNLERFKVEMLMKYLLALGMNLDMSARPAKKKKSSEKEEGQINFSPCYATA